ncbi:MAG: hypothetical protein JRN38_02515 [Nitrososphaerota archaeon]|nr:hypothetical protein [Nitrososphaerota archaeon]
MVHKPKAPQKQGRASILVDPKVRAWYDKLCLRTRVTGDEYVRKLSFILEKIDLTPESVVSEASKDPDSLRDRLVKYASEQKNRGRLDNYIRKSFNGLRSWLKYRHVPFDGWPELSPIQGASLESERVPRPEELAKVLDKLSSRGKVIALAMAHAGVRPSVLGSYHGQGGLTLADLPELNIGKTIEFKETPFVVRVPAKLSKTKVAYTTFGSHQLATAILADLERRQQGGETLRESSPLVVSKETRGVATASRQRAEFGARFLTTNAVLEEVRGALQATAPPEVRWRGYVLRAYCSTRLLLAEANGMITRDLREAILGHDTGVAGRYNVGKKWGEELLKEARAAYRRAEPYLSTIPMKSAEETQNNIARVMLLGLGYSEKELADKDLLDPQVFQQLVKDKMTSAAPRQKQRLVGEEELPRYLDEGWTVVAAFGDHRAVLNPPGP